MTKTYLQILYFTLLSSSILTASEASISQNACIACHGSNWDKKALSESQPVSKMTHTQIYNALIGYKRGTYGRNHKLLMKNQVAKYSDIQLYQLSQTIGIKDNTKTSQIVAGACTGCHGANWDKKALGASKIVSQMTHTQIAEALKGYKHGIYGRAQKNLMKSQIAKYSDADIEAFSLTIGK